jgi:hypothetical protein
MAVAECPNCYHDIQTPAYTFGGKGWKGFSCPYCRAKLERKKYRLWEIGTAVIAGATLAGVPRRYVKTGEILIAFLPAIFLLFNLSRPKLAVVSAPYDEAREFKQRLAEKQAILSDVSRFTKPKDDAIADFRINPRRTS